MDVCSLRNKSATRTGANQNTTVLHFCHFRVQERRHTVMAKPEVVPTRLYVLGESQSEDCATETTQHEEENPFNFSPRLIYLPKDHELFEDGDVERHMYLQDLYISETQEDKATLSVSEFACHISGCNATHSTLEEYEHHYNSLHRHVCCSCRRSLPTSRLLDIHIQEWHDSLFMILAQRQDMYQCLVEGCEHTFRTSILRKDHLVRIHKYPPDFRFDKPKRDKGLRESKHQQQTDTAMEVVDDGSEVLRGDNKSKQVEQEESMEMLVSTAEVELTEKCASAEEQADIFSAVHNTTNTRHGDSLKPRYSYRVPSNVCFGHGSIRGFKGHRGRRK
ncbi:zinc finger protein 511 [Nerophis lumbriciformis]|uniref:zinc finger protein 511 n=1 Tax=Nerophis lumbriciformis TaxID=546530 RepID=UPI002ADF1B43|nr:zinc finger protein 511-like [Nerophis lumbriciformis]